VPMAPSPITMASYAGMAKRTHEKTPRGKAG
jgi:hypothetical protein